MEIYFSVSLISCKLCADGKNTRVPRIRNMGLQNQCRETSHRVTAVTHEFLGLVARLDGRVVLRDDAGGFPVRVELVHRAVHVLLVVRQL